MDYDHWWMARYYAGQMRSGEIGSITNLLIFPDTNELDEQLLGWPIG